MPATEPRADRRRAARGLSLTRQEATQAREDILRQLSLLTDREDRPSDATLSELGRYIREVGRILGAETTEELSGAYTTTFRLSPFEAGQFLSDETPVSAPAKAPTEIGDADLVSVLGETSITARYLQLTQASESPALYHAASFLTAVSGAVRRRCMVDMDLYRLYPNLFTILVGRSGIKKDTAIDFAVSTVYQACNRLNVLPKEMSPQGLIDDLRDRYGATGISDGLLVSEEIGVTFSGEDYKKELGKWVTDLFKCQDRWARRLRNGGRIEVENVYFTLLAASTPEWLRKLPPDMLKGGFFPRVWIAWAGTKRGWKWKTPVDREGRTRFIADLLPRLDTLPERLTLSPAADRFMEAWYEQTVPLRQTTSSGLMEPYFERVHVLAVKLAAVLHVLDGTFGSVVIAREHCERAVALLALTEPGTETVLRDLSASGEGELVREVLDWLRSHDGRATKRELYRAFQLRFTAKRVTEALNALAFARTILTRIISGEEHIFLADLDAGK